MQIEVEMKMFLRNLLAFTNIQTVKHLDNKFLLVLKLCPELEFKSVII